MTYELCIYNRKKACNMQSINLKSQTFLWAYLPFRNNTAHKMFSSNVSDLASLHQGTRKWQIFSSHSSTLQNFKNIWLQVIVYNVKTLLSWGIFQMWPKGGNYCSLNRQCRLTLNTSKRNMFCTALYANVTSEYNTIQ